MNSGGFFFVANPSVILDMTGGTNWNHLMAYNTAGYCEGTTLGVHSSFSLPCMLGNITSTAPPANPPPYSSGGLSVSGCDITCNSIIPTLTEMQDTISGASNKFSVYKFTGTTVLSSNNVITGCVAKQGAVYYLDHSTLTDDGSTFQYNGAMFGGVAYCISCVMKFSKSKFIGNFAN
jgi:hypothetical protein